jgi:exodeoxyribonuclease V beta subunit
VIEETQARPFDIRGPLPSGVTVLEASAGTGKTYTIAALAARYVAEGIPLERVLLVTFTRMATGELRERVRERLVSVERGLDHALAAGTTTGGDPVVELLSEGSPHEVRLRRDRVAHAVADFDAGTIATTHGFCQEALGGLGIAGDLEPDITFVEDISDLVAEVIDDLYVRRFYRGDAPPFGRAQAAEIARVAVANLAAPIAPAVGDVPEMRRRLALAIRQELERRKRSMAVMTYDDLLTRLDSALTGDGGLAIAARLRARYDVVLVDEFQDTDPVQWDIMRRAFGDGRGTLVLIGDPKQAIYAFRGADVYAYLDAAAAAGERATLRVNWRSDQGLIDAYDALFGGAKLGHEGIVYRRVRAADANQTPRLQGAPNTTPLRIRVVQRDSVSLTRSGCASNKSARKHIAKDLAADAVALLSSDAEVELRSETGDTLSRERVRPRHVAVLVRTNRNAALVREALDAAGIPAVINGAGSVFATDPAREWLRLLEGLERPASTTRAHSAALTRFLGWSPEQIAAADDDAWEEIHRRLHDWARVLRLKGVASLTETITLVEGLPQRVLAQVDGERWLTDLRHTGQLLHAAASTEQMGTTALTAWLRRRIAEARDDTSDEERSRRLESDAEAVQVLTIHRSKGLEFPIVYLPFLWEPGYIPDGPQPVFFHDPDADDARTINVALEGPDFDRHQQQYMLEQRGEDLRLAYVALTRARHQAIVWWAGSWDSRNSPIGRLLFARDADGNVPPAGTYTPDDSVAVERFESLAAEAPASISVEHSTLGVPTSWSGPPREAAELTAAIFGRSLDRRWRRTSYSDITAGTYDARVASEPETNVVTDEPATEVPIATTPAPVDDAAMATPSLLADMPVGMHVGTLVHRVFEATDFAAPDLDAELEVQLAAVQAGRAIEIGDPAAVVAGLRAAIETPLGALLGGTRLRDVRRADRLDELEFELPLVGGDEPTGWLTLASIADVLREHLPADDPLAGYADRLDDQALRQTVRGYLTGSLDLVVRIGDADGASRFAVLDYKTNWLGGPDEQLTAWHHRPSALAAEMQRRHYGLQALLYTVALHRYLRWRVPDYDPDRNLAGVLYLFLRGMIGPDTPTVDRTPCGVFAWQPSKVLVEALSDVLDRGKAA